MMTMLKINLHSKLKQNNQIFANEIDNEAVMLNIDIGKYFGLNEIGCGIWKILSQETSVTELYQRLAAEYDISLEKCQNDVEPFLYQLIENNLINVVETANA